MIAAADLAGLQLAARTLDVWLEGNPAPVGVLRTEPASGGAIGFHYAPAYLGDASALPLSASLPLRAAPYADAEARAYFDNLLPEGERRRTEALVRRLDANDVFGLLAALGRECPGAISVLPPGEPPTKVPGRLDTDYDALDDGHLARLVADVAAGRSPSERVRFSLAGVQQKLALARDPTSGAFFAPRAGAPTTHLIKVEPTRGEYQGIVANEALCIAVLRRLGLPTVRAERAVFGGVPALVVARYDRHVDPDRSISRLHQEDAAQVLGIPRELKYEHDAERVGVASDRRGFAGLLGRFAAVTRSPVDARLTLLRAAHANWLLGNCDAHLKNFAVGHGTARTGTLRVGGRTGIGADLAPLYDVVCVGAYPNVDQTLAMRIGRTDRWDQVEREDWLALAQQIYPGRRVGAGVLARQLGWLRETALAVLPAIDAVVAEGTVSRNEARPVRDVVGSRVRHLNRTLEWGIPAETDAPIRRGGGWALS